MKASDVRALLRQKTKALDVTKRAESARTLAFLYYKLRTVFVASLSADLL
jgi:hypothetical protein